MTREERQANAMGRLILFDVDKTPISINHGNLPQRQALNTASKQVHGIPHAFEGEAFVGGKDLPMMVEVYRRYGLVVGNTDSWPDISAFKAPYFWQLTRNLAAWTHGTVRSGVPELLDSLASIRGVHLGLETGNFREAAFIKLRRYGSDQYFTGGGFGGNQMQRSAVVANAIANCQSPPDRTYLPEAVFVIGDSASDVEAGHANGVMTLAVATGFHSLENLAGLNPSYALPGLSDTAQVLDLLLSEH